MLAVYNAFLQFIWAHAINTFHKNITKHSGIHNSLHQRKSKFKSRVALQTAKVKGDNRNLFHSRFLKGTADKSNIVGCTASAACLGHDDCSLVQVVFA